MKTLIKASEVLKCIKRITESNKTNNYRKELVLQVKQLVEFKSQVFSAGNIESIGPKGVEVGQAGESEEVGKARESEEVDSNFGELVPNDDINDDWLRRLIIRVS